MTPKLIIKIGEKTKDRYYLKSEEREVADIYNSFKSDLKNEYIQNICINCEDYFFDLDMNIEDVVILHSTKMYIEIESMWEKVREATKDEYDGYLLSLVSSKILHESLSGSELVDAFYKLEKEFNEK